MKQAKAIVHIKHTIPKRQITQHKLNTFKIL